MSKFTDAELFIKKGILISKEIKSDKLLQNFYYQLFELNNQTNNYNEALQNYIKYTKIKDSLLSEESKNVIAELEIQYQTEQKEQKIEYLSLENKFNNEKIQKQYRKIVFFVFGAIFFLISFIIVFLLYIQRNRAFKMLVKRNVEITKFEQKEIDILTQSFEKEHIVQKISTEQEILDNLLVIMNEKKYFLNQICTIERLAKEINTNRQYLSQIINQNYNYNFNNFINSYRIKEARKLLLAPENQKFTIEAIGEKSGFKNRASFNSAFKKFTGVTPSFFKKEQQTQKN